MCDCSIRVTAILVYLKGALYSFCKASEVTWQNRVIFYVDGNIMVVNYSLWLITEFLAPVC